MFDFYRKIVLFIYSVFIFIIFFSNYLFSDLVYKHVDVGRAKHRQERILSWYYTFPITEDWNFSST